MTIRHLTRAALLAGLVGGLGVAPVAAERAEGEAIVRERAIAHGISASWLVAVVDCETGRTWRTDLIGRAGERGPLQLHPRGELPTFYARGYHDPTDWWEASDFAAARFAEGGARAWSCA